MHIASAPIASNTKNKPFMQTLFDIRKRTEYASYEKHVDNAPKAPREQTHPSHRKQKVARPQNMQFRKRHVTAQARRQKDQPRHFNRRQKTHPTPRKQIYIGRDMRQCEPNTHISSMRDGQRKLRINRPSKLFHKKRETSPKKYLDEA